MKVESFFHGYGVYCTLHNGVYAKDPHNCVGPPRMWLWVGIFGLEDRAYCASMCENVFTRWMRDHYVLPHPASICPVSLEIAFHVLCEGVR